MDNRRSIGSCYPSSWEDPDAGYHETRSWWSQLSNGVGWDEVINKVEDCNDSDEDRTKGDARGLVLVSSLPSLICSAAGESNQQGGLSDREPRLSTDGTFASGDGSPWIGVANETVRQETRRTSTSSTRSVYSNVLSFHLRDVLRLLGPGWLVAMAYVDPGNLEGDLVAGAARRGNDPAAGYRLLWVLVSATLMGFLFQRLAIKLGTVTGRDLATLCRYQFPRWIVMLLWFNTELCLIGADMQSVIGSAVGLQLLFSIPMNIGILVTLTDSLLVLLVDVWGTRRLETCFSIMISMMAVCFFINMFTSKPNFQYILSGLLRVSVPTGSLSFAVALVGSVVMPHNFFLQSAVVQSRALDRRHPRMIERVTTIYTVETFLLLVVSLLVNVAVVVAFANPKINTAEPLNLYNAHLALETAIGQHSAIIWGIGLLAAGQCSTVACTYAGQFVMEGLLGIRLPNLWSRIVVTRLTSLLPLIFLLSASRNTVETIASAVNVLQAFNLPFVLLLLLKFTSSEDVMGPQFRVLRHTQLYCFAAAICLIGANVSVVVAQLADFSLWALGFFIVVYFTALVYVWQRPIQPYAKVYRSRSKSFREPGVRCVETSSPPVCGVDTRPFLSHTARQL